jgi:hypothetical protein
MKRKTILSILVLALVFVICKPANVSAASIGTAFTYQGRLIDANKAAYGLYDFQFKLFDANSSGNELGANVNLPEVNVIDGYFTVALDFGSVFDGNERWLEIGVRPGYLSDPNVYTILIPRQKVTPTPYALQTRGIFVGNTGNVGIGTTGPNYKLDVNGNVNATAYYGDGSHLTGVTSSGFGAWATKSNNTVYQAATDGFVIYMDDTTGQYSSIYGYTDGNPNPATVRAHIYTVGNGGTTQQAMFTMPVRKGDYWKVNGAGTPVVYWLPLGN